MEKLSQLVYGLWFYIRPNDVGVCVGVYFVTGRRVKGDVECSYENVSF